MNLSSTVKDWYVVQYSHDDYALEKLNPTATFEGVFRTLEMKKDIYQYLFIDNGVDSIIRENVFAKLAEIMNVDYSYIYKKWLNS